MRGARGRLRRRPSAFFVISLPLARGLVPRGIRYMRGLGVGSRTGLGLRPAPRIWRIIPQASSGIRAGGAVPAPVVGASSLPARSGGRPGRATAGAVIPAVGGTVSTSSGGGSALGGALLGPAPVVPLWGAVGPAVGRAASSTGACTAVVPAIFA